MNMSIGLFAVLVLAGSALDLTQGRERHIPSSADQASTDKAPVVTAADRAEAAAPAPRPQSAAAVLPRAATRARPDQSRRSAEPVGNRRVVPWYVVDPSLRRGDIVVLEGEALVFEGSRGGRRQFKTVGLSRLVSRSESDQILKSLRR